MIDVADLHACRGCRILLPCDDEGWKRHKGRKEGQSWIDQCRDCHRAKSRESYRLRTATEEGREKVRQGKREWARRARENDIDGYRERNRRNERNWRKRHPKKSRRTARKSYHKRMQDAEVRAWTAIDVRFRTHDKTIAEGKTPRLLKHPNGVDLYKRHLSPDEHFDPQPFIDWIAETYPGLTLSEVARRLDVSERTLRGIHDGDMLTVSILCVDHAFVAFGRPELLNELYPLKEKSHA